MKHFGFGACLLAAVQSTFALSNSEENVPVRPRSFSACLLVKDDNHLLDEWIAYHYHTLPLRHLVVAVDPDSITTPKDLLKKWEKFTELETMLWTDRDYRSAEDLTETVIKKHKALAQNDTVLLLKEHRVRQRNFYGHCLNHFKKTGQAWVTLIDTDEFVAPNESYIFSSKPQEQKLSHFISENHEYFDKTPCFPMARTLFGPRVDATEGNDYYFPAYFRTLEYFYHDAYGEKSENGYLKVMVDVRKFTFKDLDLENIISGPHRPLEKCVMPDYYHSPGKDSHSVLRVHHYLGSKEEYFRRNDARRDIAIYDRKADSSSRFGPNIVLKSWLDGFMRDIGSETASVLLNFDSSVSAEL